MGDCCFSTCPLEDELVLAGIAQGGGGGTGGNSVKVWIFGLSARTFPSAGQSAEDITADLAAEVNADVALSGIGVSSVAIGNRLVTNGSITGLQIKDQGIFPCAVPLPSSSRTWLALLAAALCGSTLWHRAAGGTPLMRWLIACSVLAILGAASLASAQTCDPHAEINEELLGVPLARRIEFDVDGLVSEVPILVHSIFLRLWVADQSALDITITSPALTGSTTSTGATSCCFRTPCCSTSLASWDRSW